MVIKNPRQSELIAAGVLIPKIDWRKFMADLKERELRKQFEEMALAATVRSDQLNVELQSNR